MIANTQFNFGRMQCPSCAKLLEPAKPPWPGASPTIFQSLSPFPVWHSQTLLQGAIVSEHSHVLMWSDSDLSETAVSNCDLNRPAEYSKSPRSLKTRALPSASKGVQY